MESREVRQLQPTVIAKQVHPQHRTDFHVTCDSRGNASEVETENRRRRNLEGTWLLAYVLVSCQ